MYDHTNNTTNLKAIEQSLFQHLQGYFHEILLKVLEDIDVWLMESQDHQRYKYEEKQAASMDTVFGSVRVKRRKQEKGFETDWMRPMGSEIGRAHV